MFRGLSTLVRRWRNRQPDNAAPPAPAPPDWRDDPSISVHARTVLERFADLETPSNRRFFRALAMHLAGSHDDPCLPMYFNFALSSNARGRKTADFIGSIVPLAGKRMLDVGCAYGGFLVAFAERGADPSGFDIDPSLLALSEHNFQDVGRAFPVHRSDVTRADDIAAFRDSFDVVTCNDVIEHVADPGLTIEHIGAMLKSGGLAYFEIPNRDDVAAVIADGHYQLFGIAQLDHDRAHRYFDAKAPGVRYDVGHYLSLKQYRALFERAGLAMEVHTDPATVRSIESTHESLRELRASLPSKIASVPNAVREEVEAAVVDYLDQAEVASMNASDDPASFLERYASGFWRVIGTKAPQPKAEAAAGYNRL